MSITQLTSRHRTLWLLALGAAAVALFSVLVPLQTASYGTPLPVAMLLGAGLCAAPLVSLTHPRTSVVVFCVAAVALPLVVSPDRDPAWPWPWSVAAMIAFAVFLLTITVVHGWRLGLVTWTVGNLGALCAPLVFPDPLTTAGATANLIVTASISATALLVGSLVAGRIRVGDALNRSLELTALEQSRRELVEERTRIARELHDVVAHGMSVIQVQASTARYRIPDLPAGAASEFDDIASAARSSLAEMRRLLGVLRTEDQVAELAPQQGIADIPALVDSVRRAGVEVAMSLSPPPVDAPASLQITAYRIIQEALSNAVRHAPGSPVEVELRASDTDVTIRVHNGRADGPPDAAAITTERPPVPGHGLRGMKERVALLAGTLVAGPDPAGGWTVTAVLPWAHTAGEPE